MSTIHNPTYSNTTITSASLSSGGGITYTAGTSTWAPNGTTTGTMHAKDLMLDGVSLKGILEERLAWMVPNPELEQEWTELKRLGDEYRKLEADLKEKGRIWQALKKK